jgi:hypothetical protein
LRRVLPNQGKTMKALTLWQPWASLMAHGLKTIETRPVTAFWAKNFRGSLAIHAAKNWNEDVLELLKLGMNPSICFGNDDWRSIIKGIVGAGYKTLGDLPTGAVLCVVNVLDVGTIRISHAEGPRVVFSDGAFIQVREEGEEAYGDYRDGRLGIVTSFSRRLKNPIPCRGKQGIWEWTDAEQYALDKPELWE